MSSREKCGKIEMWLLLVAAGSGYLARCWHRTLTTKPRLTEYPHVDPEGTGEEQPSAKTSSEPVFEEPVANASVKSVSATLEPELDPKPARGTFSPKVISQKLFSSESSKSKKAAKGEAKARSSTGDSGALVVASAGKSSASAPVGHGKKSRWSSFKSKRSHTSHGGARLEKDSENSSVDYLKQPSELLSGRERGNNGSSSSRSLQEYFEDESDSAGSVFTSEGQSVREFGDTESVESSEDARSGNLQDVTKTLPRPKGESESRLKVPNSPASSSRKGVQNCGTALNDDEQSSRRAVLTSVAEAVAQIEKGHPSSKLGSGSTASQRLGISRSQTGGIVRGRDQTLDGGGTEQSPVEEVDSSNGGGKGKRRADTSSKVKILGSKVALSAAALTGKRSKENKDQNNNGNGDSVEITLASITGKRIKDGDKVRENFGEPKLSPSIAGGIVDLSQVFFGFDNTFLASTAEEKSPSKFYKKSRYTIKAGSKGNVRKMRESPKPVSALESCLRAQFPEREEGSRAARALNFSSLPSNSVSRRESLEPNFEEVYLDRESGSVKVVEDVCGKEQDGAKCKGAMGLPLLKPIPPKNFGRRGTSVSPENRASEPKYPRPIVLDERWGVVSSSKLDDILWRPATLPVAPKKRKISQACSSAAISSAAVRPKGYELEALVIPPMEGLLFSFGVGIGVMSLIGEPEKEVERLSTELQQSEKEIESLNELLKTARDDTLEAANAQLSKQVMVVGSLAVEKVTGEVSGSNELVVNRVGISQSVEDGGTDLFDLVRKEAPETPQQTEHLAELEAELEAELNALTGGIADGCSGLLDFDELDPEGVAGVANRDLGVEGLPALLDWDDDNDDFITEEQFQGGGIAPRELRRLLRKVQSSRAEHRIAELEIDLEESVEKLQMAEKELQSLREAMKANRPQSAPLESVESMDMRDLSGTVGPERTKSVDLPSPSSQVRRGDEVPVDEEISPRRGSHALGSRAVVIPSVFQGLEKLTDEPAAGVSPKWDSAGGLRAAISRKLGSSPLSSMASKLDFNLQRSTSVELGSTLRTVSSIELGSSQLGSPAGRFSDVTRPPPSDLALLRAATVGSVPKDLAAEKGDQSNAHNDNDAVCDEFLSSVFCSSEEEDNRSIGSSVASHPGNPRLPKTFSLDEGFVLGEEEGSLGSFAGVEPKDVFPITRAKSTEDLDQVVDKLLKRDSSSVKNAINAFLQWEAETDEEQEKEAPGSVGETSPLYQRRAAGKLTTPQKSISSSSSPLRTAVLASRLEDFARTASSSRLEDLARTTSSSRLQDLARTMSSSRLEDLARTTSSGSEKSYSDKLGFSPKMRSGHEKTKKFGDEDLEVFQPPEPHPEDRNSKTPWRREYQPTKTDRSPRIREGRKSMTESRRELFRKEAPVFGSVDVDLESLMDLRREKRYSSTKVELSSSVPPRERDVIPSGYRPREDSSRAGTNSPTERQSSSSVKLVYPSPKPRSSRAAVDRRLYHNLTSDWIADVGNKATGKNK